MNFDVPYYFHLLHEQEKTKIMHFNVYRPTEGTIAALSSCCHVRPYRAYWNLHEVSICPKCWGITSYYGAGNVTILNTPEMPEPMSTERLVERIYGADMKDLDEVRMFALKALEQIANNDYVFYDRRV